MRLYHTGDREIKTPDITMGRRNADFGPGFYLTPDRDFAYRWARENAVVNEYELEERGPGRVPLQPVRRMGGVYLP